METESNVSRDVYSRWSNCFFNRRSSFMLRFWLIGLRNQCTYLIINDRLLTICVDIFQMEHMETTPPSLHPNPYYPLPSPTSTTCYPPQSLPTELATTIHYPLAIPTSYRLNPSQPNPTFYHSYPPQPVVPSLCPLLLILCHDDW